MAKGIDFNAGLIDVSVTDTVVIISVRREIAGVNSGILAWSEARRLAERILAATAKPMKAVKDEHEDLC